MSSNPNSSYVLPTQQKHLRACMVCSLVQLNSKFIRDGCPNCEAFLPMAGSSDSVDECTSGVFEGLITLTEEPGKGGSWVAKWQRLDGYVRGTYAVKVTGTLPEERIQDLEDAGGRYIPRDGSATNAD